MGGLFDSCETYVRSSSLWVAFACWWLAAAGCAEPLPVAGARCPCPAPWVCDPARQICVKAADGPGQGGGPGTGGTGGVGVLCDQIGPSPLRRLTPHQFRNTVSELVGVTLGPGLLPDDATFDPQFTSVVGEEIAPRSVEAFMLAAEEASARAVQRLPQLLPCPPDPPGQVSCASQFAERFATRAYRRPPTADELGTLVDAFKAGRAESYEEGIRRIIEVVLGSPQVLYRVEAGATRGARPGVVRLTGQEIAARLSFFLWQSTPDDRLLQAAADGTLDGADGVAAETDRLLADPRAARMVELFHEQWLGLSSVRFEAKPDPTRFPAALRETIIAAARRTARHLTWEMGGDLGLLLTWPMTFSDPQMAAYYDLMPPPAGGLEAVSPRGDQRRPGLLTHPALMAAIANGADSSPVHRGTFIAGAMFCEDLPRPPPGAANAPPPRPDATTRERYGLHADPNCWVCHAKIDPLGFPFENYDGYGRWRTTENGKPIDASGEVWGTRVTGPEDLMRVLASMPETAQCQVRQWFRFAFGRDKTDADACTLARLERAYRAGGNQLRPLLRAITASEAFTSRTWAGDGQ